MGNKKAKATKSVARNDSFVNLVTGIGTGKDKRTFNTPFFRLRSLEFFEEFYASNEIARKIVESVPNYALRKGWEFIGDDKENQEDLKTVCDKMSITKEIYNAWVKARYSGVGLLYVVTKDGHPASPMEDHEVVTGVVSLSRRDLRIFSSDVDSNFQSDNYGRPELYFLNLQMGTQYKGYPIHWTRVIRFDGDFLPRNTFIRNNYFHDSVLNKLYNSVRNYESANDAIATLLQDANIGIYKMKNLANLISEGQEDLVQRRLEMIEFSKSSINAVLLDAEDEDYIDLTRNMSGVAEMLRHQSDRLVASSDVPHTILLGESPDGSNATGNSTSQAWDRTIESEQENFLRPKLNRLFQMIFKKDCQFKFHALSEPTDAEKAELMNKQAQTDALYIQNSVLIPEEVATSRFGNSEYSIETELGDDEEDAFEVTSELENLESGEASSLGNEEAEGLTEEKISELSLNGAQVTSLVGVIASYKNEELDREAAREIITTAFPINAEIAEKMLGDARDVGKVTKEGDNDGRRDSIHEHNNYSRIHTTGSEVSEDGRSANHEITGNREASVPSGNYNPSPTHSKNRVVETKTNKREPIVSISQSTPFTDPNLEDITWLKGTESKTFTPKRLDNIPRYAQAVTIEMCQPDGSLLMGRRNDNDKITTPGGMVEEGENPREAAARELYEETGYKVDPNNLELVSSNLTGRKKQMIVHHYKLDNVEKETIFTGANDPDREVSLWEWMTPEQIEQNMSHMQHPKSVILDKLGYYSAGKIEKES